MTKFCPNCGEENEDVAIFCKSCGHDLSDLTERMKDSDRKVPSKNKESANKSLNIKIIAAIILIIAIVAVAALSFNGNSNEEAESQNITLIKEYTHGYAFLNDKGDAVYNYDLKGVLKNLPDDFKGYELRTTYYDKNNNYVAEEVNSYMKNVFESSKKSQPSFLGAYQTHNFVNVSHIKLEMTDPNGTVVFNDTVDFDMAKMDLSDLDE